MSEYIELSGEGDLPCNMERIHLEFYDDDWDPNPNNVCKTPRTFLKLLRAETNLQKKVALVSITSKELKDFTLAKQISKLPCLAKFTAPSRHGGYPVTIMIFRIRR